MATNEEIRWLYRCILGREPEPDVYEAHGGTDFEALRRSFAASEEASITRLAASLAGPVTYRPPSDRPQALPSLALACIVKNGAATIERMLRSCFPIVSFAAIYDTGSSDGTLPLVRAVCAETNVASKIEEGPFINFSQARNCALDLVPADIEWVLMLDADEYLVREDLTLMIDLTSHGEIEAWQLPRYNFVDAAHSEPAKDYPDYQRRLLRNQPHIRYARPVHECVVGTTRWGYAPLDRGAEGGHRGGPHIHHTALVDMTREDEVRKHSLYHSLNALGAVDSRIPYHRQG